MPAQGGSFNPFAAGVTDISPSQRAVELQGALSQTAFDRAYKTAEEMGQRGARQKLIDAQARAAEANAKGSEQSLAINQLQLEKASAQQALQPLMNQVAEAQLNEALKASTDPLHPLKKAGLLQGFDINSIETAPARRMPATVADVEQMEARTIGAGTLPLERQINALKAAAITPEESVAEERIKELETRKQDMLIQPIVTSAGEDTAKVLQGAVGELDNEINSLRAQSRAARIEKLQAEKDAFMAEKRAEFSTVPIATRQANLATPIPAQTVSPEMPGYGAALAGKLQERALLGKMAEARIEAMSKSTYGAPPAHIIAAIKDANNDWNADKTVTDFRMMLPNYLNVMTLTDPGNHSPMSDVGAIYAFIRALDPASAVREGEITIASTAPRSLVTKVTGWLQKLETGKTLTAEQRADMRKQALNLMGGRMDGLGLAASSVIDNFGSLPSTTGTVENAAMQIMGPSTYNMLKTWQENPGVIDIPKPNFESAVAQAAATFPGATTRIRQRTTQEDAAVASEAPNAGNRLVVGGIVSTRAGQRVRIKAVSSDGKTATDYEVVE